VIAAAITKRTPANAETDVSSIGTLISRHPGGTGRQEAARLLATPLKSVQSGPATILNTLTERRIPAATGDAQAAQIIRGVQPRQSTHVPTPIGEDE
jgi:hypothetical protein